MACVAKSPCRFASLRNIAEAPDKVQQRIITKFGIPLILLQGICLELNGFASHEPVHNSDGHLVQHSKFATQLLNITDLCVSTDSWSRFVVKQTYETLRSGRGFVAHKGSYLNMTDSKASIHSPKSRPHGWEWYEMGFFVHWKPFSTTVFCFDVPKHFQIALESTLVTKKETIMFSDPFSAYRIILNEVISLYNDSVWSIRNHICAWESVRLSLIIFETFNGG